MAALIVLVVVVVVVALYKFLLLLFLLPLLLLDRVQCSFSGACFGVAEATRFAAVDWPAVKVRANVTLVMPQAKFRGC